MTGWLAARRWTRAAGVLSVLDGDLSPQEDVQTPSALVDWSVFSESGLAGFAPGVLIESALRCALDTGTQVAVVTPGLRWMRRGGAPHAIGRFPVKAVDTNGADDVFHVALALTLGQGDRDARRFAATAAASKYKRTGGAGNGADWIERDQFLAAHS